jgi:spoIIIJ-associated protein
MDESRIERGVQWLEGFLQLAALPASIILDESQAHPDGSQWLVIDASTMSDEQIQSLIGENGSVLDSIQYLINTATNVGVPEDERQPFTIELDGYRLRRQAELLAMAEAAAQQVMQTGQEYELASLSSAERRQVHTFLKSYENLETYSRGQEPDRRLVVKLLSS